MTIVAGGTPSIHLEDCRSAPGSTASTIKTPSVRTQALVDNRRLMPVRLPLVRLLVLLLTVCICFSGGSRKAPTGGGWHVTTGAPGGAVASAIEPGGLAGTQRLGTPADGAPLRLMFVGASVTEGWFASTPDRTYPSLVARGLALRQRRVRMHVLALPGVLAAEADAWDLSIPSDFVVVQLATNDFFRSTPVPDFAASYSDVLRRIRTTSPGAEVTCMGGWDDPAARNGLGAAALDYDVAARSACEAERGRYVDLSAVYLDQRNHGPVGRPTFRGTGDLFHPNDRGERELAVLVLGTDAATSQASAVGQPSRLR